MTLNDLQTLLAEELAEAVVEYSRAKEAGDRYAEGYWRAVVERCEIGLARIGLISDPR